MTDEKIHRICCVCGRPLPTLTIEQLTEKGAVTMKGDGSRLFHHPHHTTEQIIDSQSGVPRFVRGSEIER